MWLIEGARDYLGWALSVYRKVLRIAPGPIALVVAATLVSQLARLIAFFLPLKIVIVVGGPGVPRYFPGILRELDKETTVIALAIVTVLFYALHQVAERLVATYTERSANRLLARAGKLTLFANQKQTARNACRYLAESLAGVIFIALAIVLIRLVHANMAFFLVGWAAAAALLVALGGAWSERFRGWLERNAKEFVNGVSQLSLFSATAFMVAEFIGGVKFNVLFAFISLLLAREGLQQLAKAVNNALALIPLKPLVNALFFHSHAWTGPVVDRRRDLWAWIAGDRLAQWLPAVLGSTTGKQVEHVSMERWFQTGMKDLFVLDAQATTGDGERSNYLVKLYAPSRDVDAAKESTLFTSLPAGALPALPLLGIAEVDGVSCHVFGGTTWRPIAQGDLTDAHHALRGACLACRLPDTLVTRYKRSHQMLDGKLLEAAKFERLMLVAREGEGPLVERFRTAVQPLAAFLRDLPLAVYNPDLLSGPLFILETGRPVSTLWSRWTLEPIGAGWPVQPEEFRRLRKWLDAARAKRPDLARVTAEHAQLAAILFAFEKLLVAERYNSAVAMLARIFDKAEQAGVLAPERQETGEAEVAPPAVPATVAVGI